MAIDHKTPAINLLTRSTIGLTADVRLIESTLQKGGINTTTFFPRGRNIDLLGTRLTLHLANFFRPRSTANIFVEQIMPGWLSLARENFFIPNQEWCRPETVALLKNIDFVLCKTRYAEGIFQGLGHNAAYIGFTSEDRLRENVKKNYNKFLHVAGRSLQKGTVTLSQVWARHPEWPVLTIITKNPQLVHRNGASNIHVITDMLTDDSVASIQNEYGIHLCPSEAEGFGHYIGEALGCGAIVITTDAPPMNELVTRDRGVLVPFSKQAPQSLGVNFYVDDEALEAAIEKVLTLTTSEKKSLSDAGRSWFLKNKTDFERRFPTVITDCLLKKG